MSIMYIHVEEPIESINVQCMYKILELCCVLAYTCIPSLVIMTGLTK